MTMYSYKFTIVKINSTHHVGRLYVRAVTDSGSCSDWREIWKFQGLTRWGTRRWLRKKMEELKKIDRYDRRYPVNPPKESE